MTDDDFMLTPPTLDDRPARIDPQEAQAAKHRRLTIEKMHRRYGVAPPGILCGACVHLVRSGGGDGSFPKCKQFRISCSAATDWRLRWPACGKFSAREVPHAE